MRVWLGVAATACLAGAAALVSAGERGDRWLAKLARRLRGDVAATRRHLAQSGGGDPAPVLVAVFAVTLVGIWLRLRYLGQPMRYDEAYTYNFYGRFPLAVSLSAYDSPNNHLLNTALMHLSTVALGAREWAVRLPAFVFGSLIPPAVYLASRSFTGAGASCIAAGAAAGWPVLVEYSANGRGYTAIAFFFVAALASARLGAEDDRLLYRLGLSAATVALLYTTPAAVYAAASVWAWLAASVWLQGRQRPRGMRLETLLGCGLAAAGALALLYAFPLLVGGFGAVLAREDIKPRPLGSYLAEAGANLSSIGGFVFRSVPLPAIVAFAVAAAAGVVLVGARRRILWDVPAAGLPAALALTFLQRQWPYTRVWIFLVPLLLVTAAAGMDALVGFFSFTETKPSPRFASTGLSLAAVLVAFGVAFGAVRSNAIAESPDTGYAPEVREATRHLAERLGPDVTVVAKVPADAPLIYYFIKEGLGTDYFKPRPAQRYLVFVNDKGEGPQPTLETFGVSLPEGTSPSKVWEGRRSAVYEITEIVGTG